MTKCHSSKLKKIGINVPENTLIVDGDYAVNMNHVINVECKLIKEKKLTYVVKSFNIITESGEYFDDKHDINKLLLKLSLIKRHKKGFQFKKNSFSFTKDCNMIFDNLFIGIYDIKTPLNIDCLKC